MALLLTNRVSGARAFRAAAGRLVGLPAYFLFCAAALGTVAAVAASSGEIGLALFAGVHMGLGFVAAAWRVQVTGARTAPRPVEYGPMPLPGARLSSEASGR